MTSEAGVRGGMFRTAWSRLEARGVTAAALLVGVLWTGLVVLAWLALRSTGRDVAMCMFRRVTGYPCATCGGTRAAMRLAGGDVVGAVQLNPLATALVVGAPLLVMWWVLVPPGGERGRVHPRVQLAVLLIMVAANWGYVLWRFGRGEV